MDFFAAPPGTLILSSQDPEFAMVVVGFVHVTGNRVDPVTLIALTGGLTENHGVQHPDGKVTHRNTGKLYDNADDWRDALETEALVKEPEPGPDTKPILWGDKSAKTKSYWAWHTASAVFELPGDHKYPNDTRIVKIKRDEFQELKRNGFVEMDPTTGVITPETAAPETAAAEDDEDDTANLI